MRKDEIYSLGGETPPPRPFNEAQAMKQQPDNTKKDRYYDEQLGTFVNTAKDIPPEPPKWETPISFDELDLPTLDPSFLPDEFREYCEGLSIELQVPIELVVMVFLAAVGTCIQGKMAVQINENYLEQLCTYWIAALQPAERKSAVIKRIKSVLQEWVSIQYETKKADIIRVRSEQKTLSLTIEAKRKKAANAKTAEQRKELQEEILQHESEMPESVYAPELFCDNITSEALNAELEKHRALAFIEAEGGFFDVISGQYSKMPNFDTYLKAYDAEGITVTRRGAARIHIPSPHLTLCFAVQPYVLQNRGAAQAIRHKGLDGRFSYFIPNSKLGYRDIAPPMLSKHLESRFRELIFRLLDIPQNTNENGDTCYYMLHMSEGAKVVYHMLKDVTEKSLAPTGAFNDMQDWQGKSVGRTLRIAGLLHCIEYQDPHKMPISETSMNNACYLVEVLSSHARAAYGLMQEPENISIAKKAWTWIKGNQLNKFSERDCHQAIKGTYPLVEKVQEGLNVLTERHYIRPLSMPNKTVGRPPSQLYEVNPSQIGGADE